MTHSKCSSYKEKVLRKIVVNDFLALRDGFEMNCVPGVNVIIGENGTGKSTLLKLIYAVRTSFDTEAYDKMPSLFPLITPELSLLPERVEQLKLRQYFDAEDEYTNDIRLMEGDLPDMSNFDRCCEAHVDDDKAVLYFDVLESENSDSHIDSHHAIFIPENDVLSYSKDIWGMSSRRSAHFEKTYIELLSSASLERQRELPPYMVELMKKLEEVCGGVVEYHHERFYIKQPDGSKIPFAYESAGLKRFGLLWQLIHNGQIQSGSVLFLDNPCGCLNLMLMSKLAEVLMELSRHQIQIFITMHNETLARCMALHSKEGDSLMFHSMYRNEKKQIKVCSASEFELLEPNSLANARLALYDAEMAKAFGNN